jgi:P2 family phage major capsid protein
MSGLSKQGRQALTQFFTNTAKAYNGEVGQQFTATPMVENTLIEKIVEHGGWFMPYIMMRLVQQLNGQKIAMSVSGGTASRTDTTGAGRRATRNLLNLANANYSLAQVDNDIRVLYSTLDAWSEFANFSDLYNALIKTAMADDIIRVGWHGTSSAGTTDIGAHPDMSDVAVGWLQLMRAFNAGSNYLDATPVAPVELGSAEYPSLDALVNHLKYLIPVHKRSNLIALISDDLVGYAEGEYYASTPAAEEKLVVLTNQGTILQTYGGLKTIVPPYFPDGTILLTPIGNLQHYMQRSSVRRTLKDTPELNAVEDFNSSNQGYVVYDEEAAFLADGITTV